MIGAAAFSHLHGGGLLVIAIAADEDQIRTAAAVDGIACAREDRVTHAAAEEYCTNLVDGRIAVADDEFAARGGGTIEHIGRCAGECRFDRLVVVCKVHNEVAFVVGALTAVDAERCIGCYESAVGIKVDLLVCDVHERIIDAEDCTLIRIVVDDVGAVRCVDDIFAAVLQVESLTIAARCHEGISLRTAAHRDECCSRLVDEPVGQVAALDVLATGRRRIDFCHVADAAGDGRRQGDVLIVVEHGDVHDCRYGCEVVIGRLERAVEGDRDTTSEVIGVDRAVGIDAHVGIGVLCRRFDAVGESHLRGVDACTACKTLDRIGGIAEVEVAAVDHEVADLRSLHQHAAVETADAVVDDGVAGGIGGGEGDLTDAAGRLHA